MLGVYRLYRVPIYPLLRGFYPQNLQTFLYRHISLRKNIKTADVADVQLSDRLKIFAGQKKKKVRKLVVFHKCAK